MQAGENKQSRGEKLMVCGNFMPLYADIGKTNNHHFFYKYIVFKRASEHAKQCLLG